MEVFCQLKKLLSVLSTIFVVYFVICSQLVFANDSKVFAFNQDYDVDNITTPISWLDTKAALSAVGLHRGVVFAPLGADGGGGQGAGAFVLINIDDPKAPKQVFDSRDYPDIYHEPSSDQYVGHFAEIHALAFHNDYVLISTRSVNNAGFVILDLAPFFDNDPKTIPRIVSTYTYPSQKKPTNYDGYSFSPVWQGGRYVYAPIGSNGLFVIDTTDLTAPKTIAHLPKSGLYNETLRSAHVIGDLLILSPAAVAVRDVKVVFVDVTRPANPKVITNHTVNIGYQGFVYGSSFYGGGTRNKSNEANIMNKPVESKIIRYDFSDLNNIKEYVLATTTRLKKPEYGYAIDDHLYLGHYPGLSKWHVQGNKATHVTDINPKYPEADDYAFISPIGNLAVVTSDHNVKSRFNIGIHAKQADKTGPSLRYILPEDGTKGVALDSKIGISFSDFIDANSLSEYSLTLRKLGSNKPVPAGYSHTAGVVNIVPKLALEKNTTYEVVVNDAAEYRLSDQVGNFFAGNKRLATFSTGEYVGKFNASINHQSQIELGHTSKFKAQALYTGNDLSFEYSWNFGDGSPETNFSSKAEVEYQYAAAGNFIVTLTTRIKGVEQTLQTTDKTTSIQTIYMPLHKNKPKQSSTLAFDDDAKRLYVVNPDNDTLTAIDDTNLDVLFEVKVGKNPSSLAINKNQIWVTNKKADTISIINSDTAELIHTIALDYGSEPHGIVILSNQQKAYVALAQKGQVLEIDLASYKVSRKADVHGTLRHIAYDAKHKQLIIPEFRVEGNVGASISFIDQTRMQVTKSIELAPSLNPDGLNNGKGAANYLGAMAINPTYNDVWIPAKKDNIYRGMKRAGEALSFDHTVRSMAAKIELGNQQENFEQRLDFDNSDMATAAVYSPNGNMVYFSTLGSSTIWAVDSYGKHNSFSFDSMGLSPISMVISDDGSKLYIHNFLSRSVAVFNSTKDIIGSGDIDFVKSISTVKTENLVPEVLAGKKIFYDSRSPSLSQEGYMSCASCHFDGSHDGRIWDLSQMGEGFRNTIDLSGHAGLAHGPLHWTANFDEVHDFEIQIRELNQGTGLITKSYSAVKAAYASKKSGVSVFLDQLNDYVTSLDTYPRSPYRQNNGEMTATALNGRQHFIDLACYQCHRTEHLTDSTIGRLHDVGTLGKNSGQRLGAKLTGLDTPTLIGLWQSAPYLHDGSAANLLTAVARHNDISVLDSSEQAELEAFLLQLEQGDDIKHNEVASNLISAIEQPLAFTDNEYNFEVLQEGDHKLAIGEIAIKNKDVKDISYYIVAGKDAGLFSVDKPSGKVFYKGRNLFNQASYQFDVIAENSDKFVQTAKASVTVAHTFTAPEKVTGISYELKKGQFQLTWTHIKHANEYEILAGTSKDQLKPIKSLYTYNKYKIGKPITIGLGGRFNNRKVDYYIQINASNHRSQNGPTSSKLFKLEL
ncbi:Ig-like domain-containing protein [Thalassomonas sp. M1454]|uniref:Ig-like domain-containing protein n=1 Tax=Thalassomonas sp. M1454 TaxID=2594477 RepID=UPI00117DC150|nr:Ig-like domain-containing protein [Thalassomonas sp. M1454]TRX52733.1 PKD domain-containing protein [Thalassomonas sp. M1454]